MNSKKLDAATRDRLAAEIKQTAAAWSVGFAQVEEIDTINIYWAGLLAMRRAVEGLAVTPEHLLIDARRLKDLQIPQQAIVKGDCKSLTIAAASILAKTARDALMQRLDAKYPGYGFSRHKGYPVREHLTALVRLGVTPIHRRSFAPVRAVWACRRFRRGRIRTRRMAPSWKDERNRKRPQLFFIPSHRESAGLEWCAEMKRERHFWPLSLSLSLRQNQVGTSRFFHRRYHLGGEVIP